MVHVLVYSSAAEVSFDDGALVSTHLDVLPLLADIDMPTAVQVGADELTTATSTDPEVMV